MQLPAAHLIELRHTFISMLEGCSFVKPRQATIEFGHFRLYCSLLG
jgi:hypothetical protein